MKTAKVLEFPYERVRQEHEVHTAKILQLPVRVSANDLWLLPMAFTFAWMSAFKV